MKKNQSGFAVVGVAIIAMALLAGVAYTFKNAGTDNDPVALVSKAIGKNTQPGQGSGSGTKPCPQQCLDILAEYNAAKADQKNSENKLDQCIKANGITSFPNGEAPGCEDEQKAYRDYVDKIAKLNNDYLSCITENSAGWLCPNNYLPPFNYKMNDKKYCDTLMRDLANSAKQIKPPSDESKRGEYEGIRSQLSMFCPNKGKMPSYNDLIKRFSKKK